MSTTNSTLDISLLHTYCGAPNTERGRATVLGVDAKGENIVYGCGPNVIIRNIKDPLQCQIYTDHAADVTVAKFSPSGYWICSGDVQGNVRVWATNNEDHTTKLEIRPITGPIRDISWSFDNQRIIVVGEGKTQFGHVFLWDSGSPVGSISGHSKTILTCDIKPSRPFKIATGGEDALVNFYKGPPFSLETVIKKHTRFVNCVRYAPDGNIFISVSSDASGVFYDGKTAQELGTLDKSNGHKATIYSVSWSPDSKQLVTSSADKSVKLWDFESKKCIHTFTFENAIQYMQVGSLYTKNGIISLSLNGDINYLDEKQSTPTKIVHGHNKPIYTIKYDSKRNVFYSAGSEGVILSFDYGVGPRARVKGKGSNAGVVAIDIVENELVVCYQDNTIAFVSLEDFTFTGTVLKVDSTPKDVQVCDGKILVTTYQGIILIEDHQVKKVHNFNYEPQSASIRSDGKEIAVGGDDKKIHIYSLDGYEINEVKTLDEHQGRITKVRYSPDGTLLATGDSNREIIVWDVSSKTPKYDGLTFHSAGIRDLDWSLDSKLLLSCSSDKTIIVWDLERKQRAIALAHTLGVQACAFVSEDQVISAGSDFNIRSWQFKLKK